ncbi:MAG: phosphoribosylformylglycinamidine synthase [Coxiella sp. (in: Bacteria)]|nr:MAG: phosphoribosylformylglycinamidine synthase [Coxiella sp. (in: g-proteobacteria)]
MLYLEGESAFTSFRLDMILRQTGLDANALSGVDARYVFIVDTATELDQATQVRLAGLLRNSQVSEFPSGNDSLIFWVVPRFGTISPWSSKATDIVHHCGFDQVARVERGILFRFPGLKRGSYNEAVLRRVLAACHDPLIESITPVGQDLKALFVHGTPKPLQTVAVMEEGLTALEAANESMGLSLSPVELEYLLTLYKDLERNPTDIELMMFAQVNSEHCRHKIFNAKWWIDGKEKKESLFDMIRYTYQQNPDQAIVAYSDNAAVLHGNNAASRLFIDQRNFVYSNKHEFTAIVLKVETHNHPTAISPFPGAATGSGGEIRDEAATGRGAFSKAGLCGFSVSHLNIPGFEQPWELNTGKPRNMASALDIMTQGPIGAASFNNEFGRPNVCGYFRSFEMNIKGYYGQEVRGYHKPIMLAGGIGNIREPLIEKKDIPAGAKLIVLGGPGMAIGLGGGSASSRSSSEDKQALDFASVQRANPEMQRRCQEVISACRELGDLNPILSIHDVGAGGLCNAMPELVDVCHKGASIDLRNILLDEPDMSPLEIWCNESQERFVIAVRADLIDAFLVVCERERCPVAVVGEATDLENLLVEDTLLKSHPVHLPMAALFEKMPQMVCESEHAETIHQPFDPLKIELSDAIKRVLQFPCVASKQFLITIGDRSVGGFISRDQMVGPWQIPVSDVAVTTTGYDSHTGEAMAIGERAPIALLHPAASARMAVAEAITNIAAAPIDSLSDLALSANWMSAASEMGEGAALYDAVQAIGKGLCPDLNISIPVGKDSMSMQATWTQDGDERKVTSPLSVIITAAAPVTDVRRVLTPELRTDLNDSRLLLIDLGSGCNALGGSALAQVYSKLGGQPPDVDNSNDLRNFFNLIQTLNKNKLIHAYHDRSDGGLLATICEMMFAGHCGVTLDLSPLKGDPISLLFNEELGAVIQVDVKELTQVMRLCEVCELEDKVVVIGEINDRDELLIAKDSQSLYRESRVHLQKLWSETSYRIQRLRDNPDCADQEFENIDDDDNPGLSAKLTFDPADNVVKSFKRLPRVAILREQGVNGHMEMAAAFMRAGFEPIDLHMSDLLAGYTLDTFDGLVACGGFSYGDVLGAGNGWAQTILMNDALREDFQQFFANEKTFTLGVCNGCQMLSHLKSIIPGANDWPTFVRNTSEQFEARVSLVQVESTPSIFLEGMQGSVLPVVTAHGEGHAVFESINAASKAASDKLITLRYVDNQHQVTDRYPYNPNGSHQGITGLTSQDGRVMIMMPHPERVYRTVQNSWHPDEWGEDGPWLRLFRNARKFLG